ncbi:MAG: hypothetical protein ABJN95_11125 [Maribacter sp.]|uniref:hypothetical protein n=1 Tax=Maribacter sp. TaxID=1897614 RepID=UPI00329804E7
MPDNDVGFTKKRPLWKIILAIGVVGIIILSVLSIPARLQHYKDSKYCLGSQQSYESSYIEGFKNKPISRISSPDIVYITVSEGTYSRTITSCSLNSETSKKFTINDISVGDTIFKESFSNEFLILKNGQKYKFLIDKNSPELPSFD